MNESNLHNYQKEAVKFVENHKNAALLLDMGLGKTIITLTAMTHLIDYCDVSRVLVVAPKKVAESSWAQEADKWEHTRGLEVSVILGTAKERINAMSKVADIYVTSRDLFVWVLENSAKTGFEFDTLVLDELTSFKNSASKRFKALKRVRPYISRVIGLTGTPVPNGLKDIWAQMYCIDMGESLGRSKTKFIDTYFDTFQKGGIIIRCDIRKGAEDVIYKRIKPICLTMKAEDYLELPPLIEQTISLKLSPTWYARYKSFEFESVMQFKTKSEELPTNIFAANAAALCNKLLQIVNGAIYTDDHQVMLLHDEKMDVLMELIEQAQVSNDSVLVFYQYKHDCDRILANKALKGLEVRKYEDDKDLQDWNAGEIDVLLAHPLSTAYGLNLQKGGHIIIWYGTGWNAELYLQGNARLRRQGQTKPTMVYRIVVEDTMDWDAMQAIDRKVSEQDAMLEAVKSRINQYLK